MENREDWGHEGLRPVITPVSDELLVLACEALDESSSPQCWRDFSSFQADWTTVHVEKHGSHTLSFWQGPATEAMVLLTDGQPPERSTTIIDHSPRSRRPCVAPTEGTFLHPGIPLCSLGRRLSDFGIFAGWWPCEPGAKRLRLTRHGEVRELEATPDGFFLSIGIRQILSSGSML